MSTELKIPLKRIILMLLKGSTKAVHWDDSNINMMIGLTIHKKLVQIRSLNLMLIQNCNINVETALKSAIPQILVKNVEKVFKNSTLFYCL